jgi:hypothetical protein
MRRLLHISPDLALPQDTVTSTMIVYGGKGMGKTNLGAVLVEEMSYAGLRWSVLDPVGVWWGMRHSVDGKGLGVECLILGGAHGDIPIEPTGGAVIADLVADETANVIIDISRKANGEMWSVGERIRFANDYGKQLFRRQGSLIDGQRREPICQVIDEAARYIPQMIRAGNEDVAKCANTWSTIVEEGRNIGLGVVLLTQRSARLNKDVAELADIMLAFRTVGPNSIEAVIDWLGAHIPKERTKQMTEEVRSLPVGSCLAVSPGWLNVEQVIAIRKRNTFDSSATPKPGEKAARVTGSGAKPDLQAYATRMRETIERAAAEDPKALRRRITELEKAANQVPVVDPEREKMLLENIAGLQRIATSYEKCLDTISKDAAALAETGQRIVAHIREVRGETDGPSAIFSLPVTVIPKPRMNMKVEGITSLPKKVWKDQNGEGLSGPEQRIVDALAWFEAVGVPEPEQPAVAFMAGYTYGSGGYNNPRGRLKQRGLVEYLGGDRLKLTVTGQAVANYPEIAPTNAALQEAILSKVGGPERRILEPLLKAYPKGMDNLKLAEAAQYSPGSGGYNNPRGRLKSLGLIEYRDGMVYARDILFPQG